MEQQSQQQPQVQLQQQKQQLEGGGGGLRTPTSSDMFGGLNGTSNNTNIQNKTNANPTNNNNNSNASLTNGFHPRFFNNNNNDQNENNNINRSSIMNNISNNNMALATTSVLTDNPFNNPLSNNNSTIATAMNVNQTKKSKRRHFSSSPSDKYIVSGRSLKRLRLDHHGSGHHAVVNVPHHGSAGGGGSSGAVGAGAAGAVAIGAGGILFSSAQSTGTLSVGTVGTMGADLESNDEDDGGDYYDDDDEDDDGASGEEGGGGGTESVGSSFLASLPSLSSHLRRRRCVGLSSAVANYGNDEQFGLGQSAWSSNNNISDAASTAAVAMPLRSSFQQRGRTNNNDDEEDDAATCAAMTTAAVAPRRHRNRSSPNYKKGKRKRRAIGFVIDTSPRHGGKSSESGGMKDEVARAGDRDTMDMDSSGGMQQQQQMMQEQDQQQQHMQPGNLKFGFANTRKSDDLEVEELEVDSLSLDGKEVTFGVTQNNDAANANHSFREQQSMSPPVDCIPDPLLVAAQHAAGGGMGMGINGVGSGAMGPSLDSGPGVSFKDDTIDAREPEGGAAAAGAPSNWSLLVMGDCCSSVTEEETSLAEDEASLSALSIGGGDIATVGTVSGLSAGGTHGGPESEASLAGPASVGGLSGGTGGDGDRKLPPLPPRPARDPRSDSRGTAGSMEDIAISTGSKSGCGSQQHKNVFKPIQPSLRPISAVPQKTEHPTPTAGYASLNQLLGGLHNERRHRRTTNLQFEQGGFRRESSINSLGSECAGFGQGTGRVLSHEEDRSYCSLPGNTTAIMGAGSIWNNQHHMQRPHPPPFVQQMKLPPMMADPNNANIGAMKTQAEDMEMEGVLETSEAHNSGVAIGAGSVVGTSVASLRGSFTGSCGNFSRTSSCSGGVQLAGGEDVKHGQQPATVPKWKRQVKLPSHSSLF